MHCKIPVEDFFYANPVLTQGTHHQTQVRAEGDLIFKPCASDFFSKMNESGFTYNKKDGISDSYALESLRCSDTHKKLLKRRAPSKQRGDSRG
jgi:hypothetical protein